MGKENQSPEITFNPVESTSTNLAVVNLRSEIEKKSLMNIGSNPVFFFP